MVVRRRGGKERGEVRRSGGGERPPQSRQPSLTGEADLIHRMCACGNLPRRGRGCVFGDGVAWVPPLSFRRVLLNVAPYVAPFWPIQAVRRKPNS